MNFGECPYTDCNGFLIVDTCGNYGKVFRHRCPDCKREVATKLSMIDSWSMSWDAFVEKYPDARRMERAT